MMEVKDEDQAAAYLKLQDDVRQLIVDTIFKELQNYGSPLHSSLSANLLYSQNFKDQVKNVIKDQMNKY
jgi:hypothetical protein